MPAAVAKVGSRVGAAPCDKKGYGPSARPSSVAFAVALTYGSAPSAPTAFSMASVRYQVPLPRLFSAPTRAYPGWRRPKRPKPSEAPLFQVGASCAHSDATEGAATKVKIFAFLYYNVVCALPMQ